jgi:hypothetical protein
MSSSTTYTLQVGGVSVTPKADNLLITLDGVIQHTPDAYTVSGSTITFASAPGSGADFYGIIMGQSASTGQGSIGADELRVTGDGTANQVLSSDADGTMTWKDGTLSTTSATGDIIYRNNSGVLAKLAIGSAGQLLTVAGGLPSWATDSEPYLPLAGGAMTGAITTNSTFDGVDIATRDGVLSSTTTTANAALPKAGGTMTGNIVMADDTSIGISDSDERIEFDASGDISFLGCNVGIGYNNPDARLVVGSGTSGQDEKLLIYAGTNAWSSLYFTDVGNGGTQYQGVVQYNHDDNHMDFYTNQAEAMRIDSSGNVGIGQATPQTDNSTARFLHIGDSGDATSGLVLEDNEAQWEIQNNGHLRIKKGSTDVVEFDMSSYNATFGGDVITNGYLKVSKRDNMAPTDNCTDPDNDTDSTTGWSASAIISSEDGGRTGKCLKVLNNPSSNEQYAYYFVDSGALTVGKVYKCTIWSKAGDGWAKVSVCYSGSLSNTYYGPVTNSGDWYEHEIIFTATTTALHINLMCGGATNGKYCFFDDIHIAEMVNLQFEDDSDTYLFHPADNTLAIKTGGTERFRVKGDTAGFGATGTAHTDRGAWYFAQGSNAGGGIAVDGEISVWNAAHAGKKFELGSGGPLYCYDLSTGSGTDIIINASSQIMKKSSSQRYKKNIRDIEINANIINQLRPVSFEWNDKTSEENVTSFGFIAEEVEQVVPLAVSYGYPNTNEYDEVKNGRHVDEETGEATDDREKVCEAVKYELLTALLVKSIQELSAKVEALENA